MLIPVFELAQTSPLAPSKKHIRISWVVFMIGYLRETNKKGANP
jgi:hypothetical protein